MARNRKTVILTGTSQSIVANAGVCLVKPFTEYTADDFRALVSTNLVGFIHITQLAVKQMQSQKTGGSIERLLFLSGILPVVNHKPKYVGRLGQELDAESGRDALYTASMSALSAARAHLGTLDKVTMLVRLGIYLATSARSKLPDYGASFPK